MLEKLAPRPGRQPLIPELTPRQELAWDELTADDIIRLDARVLGKDGANADEEKAA